MTPFGRYHCFTDSQHSFHQRLDLKDVLFRFAFNVPLSLEICFWFIIRHEYKSLSHKQRSWWNHVMLLYVVIAGLIQFALDLVQIPDFEIGKSPHTHTHIITEPSLCFKVSMIWGVLVFHQLFAANIKVKLVTLFEGDPKAPFSIATTPRCRRGCYSIPGLLHFTLGPYLIMLSVKPGRNKYHFLSFWYDSTWDWTPVSRTIG